MNQSHYLFGIAAGITTVIAVVIYLLSIIKGETKPNRASWIIWNVTNVIVFASYFSIGARSTIFLPASYVLGGILTLIFSFRYGITRWSFLDYITLLVAGLSLLIWFFTKNPLFALLTILVMDTIGYFPTLRKSAVDPASESRIYWILIFIGALINIFAINSSTFGIIIQPIVMLVMDGAVVIALYYKNIISIFSRTSAQS